MKAVIDDGSVGEHSFSHVDWFVYLASVNGSLRITPGVPLGVNAERELCFSLEDAEHAVTFFYGDEKLLVKPEVGEVWFDDELVSQRILLEPNSTFYLGEVPVFVTTSPVLQNEPPTNVEKLVEPYVDSRQTNEPIRVKEREINEAVDEDTVAEDVVVKESLTEVSKAEVSEAEVIAAHPPGEQTPVANVVRLPNLAEPTLGEIKVAEPSRSPTKAATWRRLIWPGLAAILLAVTAIGLVSLVREDPAPAVSNVRPDDAAVDARAEVFVDEVAVIKEESAVVVPPPVEPEAALPVESGANATSEAIEVAVDVPVEVPVEIRAEAEAIELADIPETPARSLTQAPAADRFLTQPLPESPSRAIATTLPTTTGSTLAGSTLAGSAIAGSAIAGAESDPAYAAIENVNTEHLLVAAQWALRNGDGPGALILLEAITSKSPDDAQAIALRDQLRLILDEVELNKN